MNQYKTILFATVASIALITSLAQAQSTNVKPGSKLENKTQTQAAGIPIFIQPTVAYRTDYNNLPKPLTPLPAYKATFLLQLEPATDKYYLTIMPTKGDTSTFYFEKPKQKENCGTYFAPGKKLPSFVKFKLVVSGCPETNPSIIIRDKNIEFAILLSEEDNQQIVNKFQTLQEK